MLEYWIVSFSIFNRVEKEVRNEGLPSSTSTYMPIQKHVTYFLFMWLWFVVFLAVVLLFSVFLQYMIPLTHTQEHLSVTPGSESRTVQTTSPVRNQPRRHHFAVRSFNAPIKCNHCTSLMIGAQRQGTVCEECAYACHTNCAEKAPQACPVPPDQSECTMTH